MSYPKPKLRFVNANCSAVVSGVALPLNLALLHLCISKSIFYENFNSALGFYFKYIDGAHVGNLVDAPISAKDSRGQNIYARIYTSGKILVLGNINEVLAKQTILKVVDVIKSSGLFSYADMTVDVNAIKSTLVVASCIYDFRFDLPKLESSPASNFHLPEKFSGLTSKQITAHVTTGASGDKTKITFRGKSREQVLALYSQIWENHQSFISDVQPFDMDEYTQIMGDSIKPVISSNMRCSYPIKGHVCSNKVKIPNTRCWRHAGL